MDSKHQFEHDLFADQDLLNLIQDESFAKNLYASLCNVQWIKDNDLFGCSWRRAAELVAYLRSRGETYIDFYLSGAEGTIFPEVRQKLHDLGWLSKYYDE
jgi:hypothetical protein